MALAYKDIVVNGQESPIKFVELQKKLLNKRWSPSLVAWTIVVLCYIEHQLHSRSWQHSGFKRSNTHRYRTSNKCQEFKGLVQVDAYHIGNRLKHNNFYFHTHQLHQYTNHGDLKKIQKRFPRYIVANHNNFFFCLFFFKIDVG